MSSEPIPGAFLDVLVVSSSPTKYGSVLLPDADVIAELTFRG
jgi:hypothetical protein